MYKILVLDIDGTVTNSKKEISEETKQAVIDLQKSGRVVVLASGRPTPGIIKVAKELELEKHGGYILSYNGAKIINCKTEKVVYEQVLNAKMIPILYEEAIQNKVGMISYENKEVICGTDIDIYIEKEAALNGIGIKQVDNFVEYIDFEVNKCLMTGEPEFLAEFEKKMQNKYGEEMSIYRSEPFFLEFMPLGIDKANSLKKLLQYLGLTREEMICVGDGFNDLSMIQFAGLGVAMENAQTVVKEAAGFITFSNDENGVVEVIRRFM